ncbi:response regulator receiver protein [Stanieria cyanosphaera PCC 7437]|uniref:Response regulator receiver protein n=1 Tax=Stanieria cyanosphaera (strain ATCC 29371 / PCC 7437) TaxID=111780 RepID=K9XMF4_STAC7|nr:response regulator transcription factor [Stanieria cyanosphaera]AFZ33668.1 response regulator receiver protein [Stanieria cyanosphaera PCC 7437]
MIRILIVDDQKFYRETVRNILEAESDFEVIGEADNGFKGIEYVEKLKPDLALVDLEMPEMDGFTLTRLIVKRFPTTKVVILSSNDDENSINCAVQTGASGYLLKSNSWQEIAEAVRYVQRGYFQLSPGLFEKLIFHLINNKESTSNQLIDLEKKFNNYFKNLEQEILFKNELNRNQLLGDIEEQINQIKIEFEAGLKTFQRKVTQQVQTGLDVFIKQYQPNQSELKIFENEIQQYNKQQVLINHQLLSTKQSVTKIEQQIKLIIYSLIFLFINFIVLALFSNLNN